MIYVLHGENTVLSRDFVLDLKRSNNAVLIEYQPQEASLDEITSKYFSVGLFAEKLAILIDVTKDKTLDFPALGEALKKAKSPNILVFLSRATIPKTHPLLKFGFDVKEFKEKFNASIFNFLDALFEKRKNDAYKELHSLISSGTDEFEILSMVSYGIRNISYEVYESSASKNLHPFVKRKTSIQAKKYDKTQISGIFDFLYHFDLSAKTGRADPSVILPLVIEKITG